MSDALEGEIVPATQSARPTGRDRRSGEVATYQVHAVDLPNGGRVEGMDRADALRIARDLGTQAYEAQALLYHTGLVAVSPMRPLR